MSIIGELDAIYTWPAFVLIVSRYNVLNINIIFQRIFVLSEHSF